MTSTMHCLTRLKIVAVSWHHPGTSGETIICLLFLQRPTLTLNKILKKLSWTKSHFEQMSSKQKSRVSLFQTFNRFNFFLGGQIVACEKKCWKISSNKFFMSFIWQELNSSLRPFEGLSEELFGEKDNPIRNKVLIKTCVRTLISKVAYINLA